MELLPKIGIYLGIGIGVTVFAMFMIIALPHIIQDAGRQWEQALNEANVGFGLSTEEMKKMFREDPGYVAFMAKYPDAGEYFRDHGNGDGRMELTAMNFDNYNTIVLEMHYDKRQESIYYEARCFNDGNNMHMRVNGDLSIKFIEQSKCLDGDGLVAPASPLVGKDGKPVPVPEPPTGGTMSLECGDGYYLQDDVCVLE